LPGPSASPAHGQDSRLLSVHARIIRQLVDERPGPAGTDAGIAGLLFRGVQELPAGLLAAPAGRGADPAMLVHPGMLLALVAAALTDRLAGLQQRLGDIGIVAGRAAGDPAVAVQASAQFRHSRMHLIISVTFCSPRSASVSAMPA
jgi:hypothetical protein